MKGIIVHSGEWDKIYHAFNIATLYSSLGKDVTVFLTYWAVDTIINGKADCGDERKTEIVRNSMESGIIKGLEGVINFGKAFGRLKIKVCSTTLEILGIKGNLPNWIDGVGGLAEILDFDDIIFI